MTATECDVQELNRVAVDSFRRVHDQLKARSRFTRIAFARG